MSRKNRYVPAYPWRWIPWAWGPPWPGTTTWGRCCAPTCCCTGWRCRWTETIHHWSLCLLSKINRRRYITRSYPWIPNPVLRIRKFLALPEKLVGSKEPDPSIFKQKLKEKNFIVCDFLKTRKKAGKHIISVVFFKITDEKSRIRSRIRTWSHGSRTLTKSNPVTSTIRQDRIKTNHSGKH